MRRELEAIFKRPVIFHTFLFAVYPVLFPYACNMSEASASQTWLLLVVSVAVGPWLWVVSSLILCGLSVAALATVPLLVFFLSYDRLCDGLNTELMATERTII